MIELIYSLKTNLDDTFVWLSDIEMRYGAALSAKRKKEFCTARALLRHHLVTTYQVPSEEIQISLPGEQAPDLTASGIAYYVSISHSADAVAVALSLDYKLGLDVEQLKPRKNIEELKQHFPALQQTEPGLQDFYLCWTQAEAYCKYSGLALTEVLAKALPDDQVCFHSLAFGNKYMLSLCYDSKQAPSLLIRQSLLTSAPLNSPQPLNLSE